MPQRAATVPGTVECDRAAALKGGTEHSPTTQPPNPVPGTVNPARSPWLAKKIENSRRAARPEPCPRCGQPVLVGPDHDRMATTARVDAQPVTPLREVVALLDGRYSCDLIRGNLHHRDPHHIHGGNNPHPIHLEHTCTTNPEGRLF